MGKRGGKGGLFLLLLMLCTPGLSCAAEWQWMAPHRLMSMVKGGSGLWLVDVRNDAGFARGHIEGSVHIPAPLLATKRLPKGKVIVLADDSLGSRKGREAAGLLLKNGHDKVFVLDGGIPAWEAEGFPVTGNGSRQSFRAVMPDEISWAQENGIPLRLYDLRDDQERLSAPVAGAEAVEGKDSAERLRKVKDLLSSVEKKGMAAELEKPAATVLVFPTAADPRSSLERVFRGHAGEVRFLEGGYAAWAAKAEKSIGNVGSCATCPGSAAGGKK